MKTNPHIPYVYLAFRTPAGAVSDISVTYRDRPTHLPLESIGESRVGAGHSANAQGVFVM